MVGLERKKKNSKFLTAAVVWQHLSELVVTRKPCWIPTAHNRGLLPWTGGIKCWHTWSEFPFLSGCLLARPFQPESSLCMLQLPQLWKCLQQQWRSKLSTSNKSVNRRGENPAQRPQKPFGPTDRDISVSGPACVGLRVLWQRWCVWKWRAVAEYRAGLRRAVNGTLVLCLIICHGKLMILSDPTVPFNFVFIKSALDF